MGAALISWNKDRNQKTLPLSTAIIREDLMKNEFKVPSTKIVEESACLDTSARAASPEKNVPCITEGKCEPEQVLMGKNTRQNYSIQK